MVYDAPGMRMRAACAVCGMLLRYERLLLRIEHAIVPIEAGWWDNLGLAETIWCAGKIGCVGG